MRAFGESDGPIRWSDLFSVPIRKLRRKRELVSHMGPALGNACGLPQFSGNILSVVSAAVNNDRCMAKAIEDSIDFAARRQVWRRMILCIVRPMLTAMNKWQNSRAVLLRRKTARRKAILLFAVLWSL